ncbi:VWA domain-containing protein [bacterium]|nr:VWA domain-containing protein [bacterium]
MNRNKYAQLLCCSILLMLLVIFGCEKKQPAGTTQTPSQTSSTPVPAQQPVESTPSNSLSNIERINIPLDSSFPDAEAATTMNVYFIFDGSGSMNDKKGGITKLAGAKKAVEEFIKYVPGDINLGLFVFDSNGEREVVPLRPNNHERFLEAIKQIRAGRGTPLAEAIKTGSDKLIEQYKKQLGYGDYRLVVVTDGIANNIPSAAIYATQYGFPIYTIGLFVEEEHPLREYSISYKDAQSFEELQQGLTETLAETEYFDPVEFEFE